MAWGDARLALGQQDRMLLACRGPYGFFVEVLVLIISPTCAGAQG